MLKLVVDSDASPLLIRAVPADGLSSHGQLISAATNDYKSSIV